MYAATIYGRGYAGIAKSYASVYHHPDTTNLSFRDHYKRTIQRAIDNLSPRVPDGTQCMIYLWVHVLYNDGRFAVHDLPMCDFVLGQDKVKPSFNGIPGLPKLVNKSHL